MGRPTLSVVIPFFDEEESIQKVPEELVQVLSSEISLAWELIKVDDGSKDRTPQLIDDLEVRHEKVRALHLKPNSGQSAALGGLSRSGRRYLAQEADTSKHGDQEMRRQSNKELLEDIARVVLLAAFFSAMALLLERQDIRNVLFDMDTIRSGLKGGGDLAGYVFSGLVFTLGSGLLIAVGLPRLWVSAVGGIIYGAFNGSILSILLITKPDIYPRDIEGSLCIMSI